jgi:hypothetical protein
MAHGRHSSSRPQAPPVGHNRPVLVPCPRFETFVRHADDRGMRLAETHNKLHPPVFLWSRPDGSFAERRLSQPLEAFIAGLKKEGFPPYADALALVWLGFKEVGDAKQLGVYLLASERGAAQAQFLVRPFAPRFWRGLEFGEIQVVKSVHQPFPSPDLGPAIAEGTLDHAAVVAALRDRELGIWACEQLASGPVPLLSALRNSRCSLDRMAAALLGRAARIDPSADIASVGPDRPEWEQLYAEHPGAPTASTLFALDLHIGTLTHQRGKAAAAAAASREAPDVIASNPLLSNYWRGLAAVGWLRELSAAETDALRVRLVASFREDPDNLHYCLADVVFDDVDIIDDGPARDDPRDSDLGLQGALRGFLRASRGRFLADRVSRQAVERSEDEDVSTAYLSFESGGRAWRFEVAFDMGIFELHDRLNEVLGGLSATQRFHALPSADGKHRVAFADASVHAQAESKGLIPTGPSPPGQPLPRRLRRLRRVRLFPERLSMARQLVQGNSVVVATDSEVVRLDSPAFTPSWRTPAQMAWPLRLSEAGVLVRQANEVRMLAFDTGAPVWAHPIGRMQRLHLRDDEIVVGAESLEFLRLDTGEVVRRYPIPTPAGDVFFHQDFVIGGTLESPVAYDLATGQRLWTGDWPGEVRRLLRPEPEVPSLSYAGGEGRVLVISERRHLAQILFDRGAPSPALVWRREVLVPQRWPLIVGDRLFALDAGHFRCLSLENGEVLYDREYPDLSRESAHTPAVETRDLISFVTSGGLRLFRSLDGELVARYDGSALGVALEFHDRYVVLDQEGWLLEFA